MRLRGWIALAFWLAGGAVAEERARNLIVLSIDTLRSDRLGCYGNERPTSPTLDRLAAGGIRFTDASAPSPWTKPSHASIFTGLYPTQHGAAAMQGDLDADAVHLAEWLSARGFATAAVVNASWLKMQGLERGFAEFEWVPYEQGKRRPSPISRQAIRWLTQRSADERFFLFVHYMDVHSDYRSLPKFEALFEQPYSGEFDGSTVQLYDLAEGKRSADAQDLAHLLNLYDAGIRQVDAEIGRLIEYLEQTGLLRDSLLVITSDHGEEFLEHGGAIHGHTQYEEVLQVPLIVHGPGVPVGTVDLPVSLVDLVPTVLTELAIDHPAGLAGRALQATWGGSRTLAPRLIFAEADVTFPPPAPGLVPPGPHRAVRGGEYKLHVDLASRSARLYRLKDDPGELVNVAPRFPQVVRLLLGKLEAHLKGRRSATELSVDEARLLGFAGQDAPRP